MIRAAADRGQMTMTADDEDSQCQILITMKRAQWWEWAETWYNYNMEEEM